MLGLRFNGKKSEEDERKERREERAVTSVVKVIEVIGTSPRSFDDAVAEAVRTAARSLRRITGADVEHMTVAIAEGKISQYRVGMKIAFVLEDED